jgi:hypothetical protein
MEIYKKLNELIISKLPELNEKHIWLLKEYKTKLNLTGDLTKLSDKEYHDYEFFLSIKVNLSHVLRVLNETKLEHDRNILWINKTILWDLRLQTLKEQAESTIDNLYNLLTNGK